MHFVNVFLGCALLALAALAFVVWAARRCRDCMEAELVSPATLAELCDRSQMQDEADIITTMSSRDILRELLKPRK